MQAVLWGTDHEVMGQVEVVTPTAAIALAITRGRLPKPYAYTDPNEDTVAAVVGPRATLLVAADGHNGFEATRAAVDVVLARLGQDPPPAVADSDWVTLFHEASMAVLAATRGLGSVRRESRTTLTVALLAGRRLQWAGMGDSPLLVASPRAGRELTTPRHHFVGWPMTHGRVDMLLKRDVEELEPDEWVALVTDGFSNFVVPNPPGEVLAGVVRALSEPKDVATALVREAFAGGAGDNVAVVLVAPPG